MIFSIVEHPKLLNMSHDISRLVYVVCVFIVVLFALYLFLKTPKANDIYYVRRESKYFIYLFSFCLVLYVAMMVIGSDETPMFNEISTSALTIANFGMIYI